MSMNRRLFIIPIAALLAILFPVCAKAGNARNLLTSRATRQELKTMLDTTRSWVWLPTYADREGWEKLLGNNRDSYIRKGESRLSYSWPRVKATDYLEFLRSGNRSEMEGIVAENNRAVTDLLMAELAEGKGRFIDQLVNGVYTGAEMTSWALSAHIPSQTGGKALQPYDRHIIDLNAGDMGSLYSWVDYFMKPEFDKIDPEISRRLRHELKSRILDAYLGNDSLWWDASRNYDGRMLNNWSPWCMSNVLLTAMLIEDDADRYADIVYLTMKGMDRYLDYVKSDGACEEGPVYWKHAAGKTLDYADLINMATGGGVDIRKERQIRRMGEYVARAWVGDRWVVNFADAAARVKLDPRLIFRFGKAVDSDLLKSFGAMLYRMDPKPGNRNILAILTSLPIEDEIARYDRPYLRPDYTYYPETQFYAMSTPEGLFFAAKGGNNNESHNHNDVGTFSLWLDTTPLIIDAGVGTYTRQTFSTDRYKIWAMQSGWHNLPVVNGAEQQHGAKYRASDVKARKGRFELNLKDAYPDSAGIKSWVRSYSIKGREVVIDDRFELTHAEEPDIVNFLTCGNAEITEPGKILLKTDGKRALLTYDPAQFEVSLIRQQLTDPKFADVWGTELLKISLTAKNRELRGHYRFTIKQQKKQQ